MVKKINKLNFKRQKGVTLIEALLVLTLAIGFIVSFLVMYSDDLKRDYIKILANDFSNIPYAVQRRLQNDSFGFERWEKNGDQTITVTPVGTTKVIVWDTHEKITGISNTANSLFKHFLTGRKNTECGKDPAGWNAANNDGTLDGGTEGAIEKESLVSCALFNKKPYNIEMKAVLTNDPATNAVASFVFYGNLKDSDLFDINDKEGITWVLSLKRSIESALKKELNGNTKVYFGKQNTLNNVYDDTNNYTPIDCLNELRAGNECSIIIAASFTGTNNDYYLRTDGSNAMLASIDFKQAVGGASQKCVWWQNPNITAADQTKSILSGGTSVTSWTAKEVDCGLAGGNDSPLYVESIMDNSYSQSFIVGDKTTLQHMCKVFTKGTGQNNNHFTDIGNNRTPCGILKDGSVIQMATEKSYIGQAFIKDLIVDEIFASGLQIKASDLVNKKTDEKVDTLSNITETNVKNPTLLMQILGAGDSTTEQFLFTVDSNGFTKILNDFEVGGLSRFKKNVTMEQSLTVADSANFTLGSATSNVTFGSNDLVLQRGAILPEFNIFTQGVSLKILSDKGMVLKSNENLNIESNQNINILSNDKLILKGGTNSNQGEYVAYDSLTKSKIDPVTLSGLTGENLQKYQVANYGMLKHLESKSGNLQFNSTVPITSGDGNIIPKPNCLQFVLDNPDRYPAGIRARATAGDGYQMARLVMIPLYFKTYASALGNNQIFSQHAVHSVGNSWEVYMYLSGEGIVGTGGREDAAGSGIAQIFCDFSGVQFDI